MSASMLIVGVSEPIRTVITNALSDVHVMTSVPDSAAALHLLEQGRSTDIIIADMAGTGEDGFRLLEALRSRPDFSDISVIILTDADNPEREIRGLRLGAKDYLRLPLRIESLQARIDMHLELVEKHRIKQKAREQQMLFNAIFSQAPIGVSISHSKEPNGNPPGVPFMVNPMYERIMGRPKEELYKLGWAQITHPDDLAADVEHFRKLQAGELSTYSMEKRFLRPDGSYVWVHMVVSPLNLVNDHTYNHFCLIQDITERKEMERTLAENERSKSVLLANLPGMAYRCRYDRQWTMQFVSAGCRELTGYGAESLLDNRDLSFNDLIVPEYRVGLWNMWKRAVARKQPIKCEYEIIRADGKSAWVLEVGQPVYGQDGEVEALEGIILDISERKMYENELSYLIEHDAWTGMHNRPYLENLLTRDALGAVEGKRALVSVNMGAVHALSMTYGFQYSQDLIKKIAEGLKELADEHHLVFKTYEYRFVFYVKDYQDRAELAAFCETISRALASLLTGERVGWGIGVIEIDEGNQHNHRQLLRNLLVASEKALGASDKEDYGIQFFDKELEVGIDREEHIISELSSIAQGLGMERLFLHFQPIMDLASGRICCFEALARLKSTAYGLIPPLEFIPIAEKTRLIIPLGEWIVTQAFRFLNMMKKHGFDEVGVSINISPMQLLKHGFVTNLVKRVQEAAADPASVNLEITESIFFANFQEVNAILGELEQYGFSVSIDDFGTGYSSLSREREMNVNSLKIDKEFIDKLMVLKPEQAITGDIISMAHKLGHIVVAEGVEHHKQLEYLKAHGCDKVQGYLISKPMDEVAAIVMLQREAQGNPTNDET